MKHLVHKLVHRAAHATHHFKPSTIRDARKKRGIYQHFTEQNGFVYFGYVDHADDDHNVVRGLTATSTRKDAHYSVGTQNGYDLAFVERKIRSHTWTVLDITLKNAADFPHIFIGSGHHSERFYAHLFFKFRHLRQVPVGTYEIYDPQFLTNYRMFSSPSSFLDTERIFSARLARVIGSHFRPLAIEIAHGHLYIYADNQRVTQSLLQTMLQNGLWLAEELDKSAI
jgi:hypothetical protein